MTDKMRHRLRQQEKGLIAYMAEQRIKLASAAAPDVDIDARLSAIQREYVTAIYGGAK